MSIATEIQSLASSAPVELFVLDTTNLQGGTLMHFHAGTNRLSQPVLWQGQSYTPLPIEAEGFDKTIKGTLPRPKLRIANLNGMFSSEVREHDDLVGCKVTRKKTYARYLDAINFPGGINPDADPNQYLPDELWFIDRKVSENRYMIEWELASAFDLNGVQLPNRQVIQNACSWRYRGPECGYTGPYYDKDDKPTVFAAADTCPKRLSSCKVRQGEYSILTFGGYPGAKRYG